MIIKRKIHSGERGVALVFALGILALLMMMMVAFVSSMLLQYQSSNITSRAIEADTLADSAMNRALGIMRLLIENAAAAPANTALARNFNRVVSITNSSAAGDEADAALKIAGVYEYDSSSSTMARPYWITVRDTDGSAAPKDTDRIIGRFAFAVVPNNYPMFNFNGVWGVPPPSYDGRSGLDYREIPVSDLLESSLTETNPTSADGDEDAAKTIAAKWAVLTNLPAAAAYVKGTNAKADMAAVESNLSKYFTSGIEAKTFFSIANTNYKRTNLLGITIPAADGGFGMEKVNSVDRVEKLLPLDKTNGKIITDLGAIKAYEYSSKDDDSDNFAFRNGVVPLTAFFNKFTDAKTFTKVEYLKKQIAANIIDFAMPATATVTSDVDPKAWWFDNEPKYTGNKKTCYISEVGLVVAVTINVHINQDPAKTTATPASVEYMPVVEIVNIYPPLTDSASSGTVRTKYFAVMDAKVSGDMKIDGAAKSIEFEKLPSAFSGTVSTPIGIIVDTTKSSTVWTNVPTTDGYYLGEGSLVDDKLSGTLEKPGESVTFKLLVNKLSMSINGVKLSYYDDDDSVKQEGIDFAAIHLKDAASKQFYYSSVKDDTDGTSVNMIPVGGFKTYEFSGEGSHIFYFSCFMQVNDPRQNLNESDWFADVETAEPDSSLAILEGSPFNLSDAATGKRTTLGKDNFKTQEALGSGSSEMDTESASSIGVVLSSSGSTPVVPKLSTAYIKEAAYKSIWELGAVHRGIAWQTINLKKANAKANGTTNGDSSVSTPTTLSGDYQYGDAEIADFVYLAEAGTNLYGTNFDINSFPTVTGTGSNIKVAIGIADDAKTWTAMFKNVDMGSSAQYKYDGNGTSPDQSAVEAILTQMVKDNNSAYVDYYCRRRSDIASAMSYYATNATTGAKTDAELEAYFGRTANLLEANRGFPNTVRLVVVADIINDVGGSGNDLRLVAYDSKGTARYKNDCRIGNFDQDSVIVDTKPETVYFDEVVARRKMLVTVQYDPNATDKLVVTDIQDID